jgi:class 3 adenylate cyclase/tetratricopeptide (TPR) repeat protein
MAPEAERRHLTVMFCDLVDSTRLSRQLDPEDYRAVVRAYQEAAAAVIQHFDGYIAQYLGDGLLVYFGYPHAHEDEAQRAVQASLELVEAMAPLNTRLEPQSGVQVAVRVGLHTGLVVIGEMGGGRRQEQLAMGDTPNIAARLQGLAAPNTVVLSAVTARLVHEAFALEERGLHHFKGVAEPMAVFRVLGPQESPDDGEEAGLARVPFLVGRNEEVGLLLRRWEQSKAGLGQVVLLNGEAGIGKSALVQTLREHVGRERCVRLTFRCSPYHTSSALYPVIAHFQRLLRWERDEAPEARLVTLERLLDASRQPLAEVVPLLAALLAVPLPEGSYPALTLSPQQQRQQTLDALVAWLLAEAERQPVLAVYEDLHWADPSTLELLGALLAQVPTVPMRTVGTYRPTFVPPWPSRAHLTPMTLNRLERPQVEALITHLARGKALPAEVVAHIVAKTDGVPLFIEELTKMLLESDLLREDTQHHMLTGPLTAITIPATLQDSLMARLDRLGAARDVAQLGAVVGREFAYGVLQALAPLDEATLQARLAQLVEAELLYQRGRPPRARYVFKHALIQEAAYASLLKSTRQQVHQQSAQVIETQFPALVETQPELVAQHYTAAGCAEQAVHYWQKAGEQASDRSAYLEAVSHLTTGIELFKTLPETPERTQQALTLYIALGAALIITKGNAAPEVERAYTQAYALCQRVGEPPELGPVLFGLWRCYIVRPQFQTARELGETLLRLAQHAHDPALAVLAHYILGNTWIWLGALPAAHQHLGEAMARYTPDQGRTAVFRMGPNLGVSCRYYTAVTLWLLGYSEQALARIHEALALAHALSHPWSLALAWCWAAMVSQLRRDVPAAHEQAEAAVALTTEQGFPQWTAMGTSVRGWALALQDQGEEGLAQVRQGLAADCGRAAQDGHRRRHVYRGAVSCTMSEAPVADLEDVSADPCERPGRS